MWELFFELYFIIIQIVIFKISFIWGGEVWGFAFFFSSFSARIVLWTVNFICGWLRRGKDI